MGNNDPQSEMMLQNHRNGLTPTDGHDSAYKRSPRSARSSKKSRPERASYLMATGHLELTSPNKSSETRSSPKGDTRSEFRKEYVEVPTPMKTSPPLEYFLKDNKRRNKRCCLWFTYSTLMTICFAIILYCIAQLVLRHQDKS